MSTADKVARDTLPRNLQLDERPGARLSVNRILRKLSQSCLLALALPFAASAQSTVTIDDSRVSSSDVPQKPLDPMEELSQTVSQAVVALDATGKRTSEAISNSSITLTLGPLQDSSRLSVVCLNGGAHLLSFTQSLANTIGLTGMAQNPSCSGAGHDAHPFKIEFRLHREEHSNSLFYENPLVLPLRLMDPHAEEQLETHEELEMLASQDGSGQRGLPPPPPPPDQPVPLNAPHKQSSHAEITLPEGWSPATLPPPVHSDSPFATYDWTVTFADGKLVADQQLVIKKDKVEVAEMTAFEKWFMPLQSEGPRRAIRLASIFYYPESAFTGNTDDEKKAAELISQAGNFVLSKNFTEAETMLKQAAELDSGHELLHEGKGGLAEAKHDYEAALAEYKEELRAFPNAHRVMGNIASIQSVMGRNDDAIQTLQTWIAAEPGNSTPVTMLMALYSRIHRHDLAVRVGDQAMLSMGEDGRQSVMFLGVYGQEQLRTSQPQAGKATLEKLLDITCDLHLVNAAVHLLSQYDLLPDNAEETLRAALKQLDDDDEGQISHFSTFDDKQNTDLLYRAWGNLGWILYNKGRLAESEAYLRAAWRGRPEPIIGGHLVMVLAKQEKPVEMLDAFKLALATIPPKVLEQRANDPATIQMRAAIEEIEKRGYKSTIVDASAALAQMNVLDAGPAGKLHGETKMSLHITSSGIVAMPYGRVDEEVFNIVNSIKVPPDFFPPGSHAAITREAKLNCNTTCTLTLLPLQSNSAPN